MKQIARTAPDTMAPCSVPSRALDDKYDFISRSKTATPPPPPPPPDSLRPTLSILRPTSVWPRLLGSLSRTEQTKVAFVRRPAVNVCPLLADVGGLFLRLSANVLCPLSTRSSRTHPKRKEKFPCI